MTPIQYIRCPAYLLLTMLTLFACGSSAPSGHGWQGYQEAFDTRPSGTSTGSHGPRIHGEWTIVEDGLSVEGALDLSPPPEIADARDQTRARQSELSTHRHMVFSLQVEAGQSVTRRLEPRWVTVEVLSRGDAILAGTPEHRELESALTHPAIQASHSAEVAIYPGYPGQMTFGTVPERLYLKGTGTGRGLAGNAGRDNLLGYDFQGARTVSRLQRIDALVRASRAEKQRLDSLGELVALQIHMLRDYRANQGYGYSDQIFIRADRTRQILRWHTEYREWGDPALGKYRDALLELFVALTEARDAAWASVPKAKTIGQSAVDAVKVVPYVAESVGVGLVETARMARDLGTHTADVFGEGVGLYDIQWEPWSAVGQAYASGKSTSEIAWSMVEGVADSVDRALYAANRGDYAPLMNLSGALAAELVLMGGLARVARVSRTAPPNHASSIGARAARRYRTTLDTLRALRARLKRARNVPGRVRDELDALGHALGRAIQPDMIAAAASARPGARHGLADGLADLRQIYAVARLDKARARTLAILESRVSLGDAGRARARSTVARVERLATTAATREAVKNVLTHIDSLPKPAAFLSALDRTLAVSARFESEHFASLLRRATRTPDPAGYLDDIRWLAELKPEARHALAYRAAQNRTPDLTWLRAAELNRKDLEALAIDPSTNWTQLQQRARLATDLPAEVRAVIGKRVNELTHPPPGTELWTPRQGRRQLRWKRGQGAGRPVLTVDSDMRIVVGGADDLNRAALGRNMRQHGPKLRGHQDHHIVPIEVARDHELFRAARTRGSPRWDPNHPDNGIQLPASEAARAAVPASANLPIHNSHHRVYTTAVREQTALIVKKLKNQYASLDKVPAEELAGAAKAMEDIARQMILKWTTEHGAKLQ